MNARKRENHRSLTPYVDDFTSNDDPPSNVDVLRDVMEFHYARAIKDYDSYILNKTTNDDETSDKKEPCASTSDVVVSTSSRSLSTEPDADANVTLVTEVPAAPTGRSISLAYSPSGYSVLTEHSRINVLLKNSCGAFLDVDDPYVKSASVRNTFEKQAKRTSKGYAIKEFFVKTLNTREKYSFFKSVATYLRAGEKTNVAKPWQDTMTAILDYASRLCFGSSLDELMTLNVENVYSSFIMHAIPRNERDSKSCETTAKFSFLFRFFIYSSRVPKPWTRSDVPKTLMDFKITDTNDVRDFLRSLSVDDASCAYDDRIENMLAFVFEPVVCCMYRTGLILYGYDAATQSVFPSRSYVNAIVADETQIFIYLIEFSGIIDNLIWCKERKKISATIVSFDDDEIDVHRRLAYEDDRLSHVDAKKRRFRSSRDLIWLEHRCIDSGGDDTFRYRKYVKFNLVYARAYLDYRCVHFDRTFDESIDYRKKEREKDDTDDDRYGADAKIVFDTIATSVTDEDLMLTVDKYPQHAPKRTIFSVSNILCDSGDDEEGSETLSAKASNFFSSSQRQQQQQELPRIEIDKIRVTWSNVSNGQKDDLIAHLVYDRCDNLCNAGPEGPSIETCTCRRLVSSLSAFKCIKVLTEFYNVRSPRVYELDFAYHRFKTTTMPFVTINPVMYDMEGCSVIVFQYDYEDVDYENVDHEDVDRSNEQSADSVEGFDAADVVSYKEYEDVAKTFKCIYYKNSVSFSDKENVVDEKRASFPLKSSSTRDRWRSCKLFFAWYVDDDEDDSSTTIEIEQTTTSVDRKKPMQRRCEFEISTLETRIYEIMDV